MNLKDEWVDAEKIAADHPACEGHFANNPILPGVVILEHVRIALKKRNPGNVIRSFGKVKFTHSLKPGETLAIHFERADASSYRFLCRDSLNNQIAIGELTIR